MSAPIEARGGKALRLRLKAPVYLQTDARWASDQVGGSRERLRNVGCTVCCLSMALHVRGVKLNPRSLNYALIEYNGYTSRGELVWDAVRTVTSDRFEIVASVAPTHGMIDRQLEAGNPVIAKIELPGGIPHWVLITGKQGLDYLIHDPLGSRKGYEPLVKYQSKIERIRYLHNQ